VYVEVFLEGELNAGFQKTSKINSRKRWKSSEIYSDNKVQVMFSLIREWPPVRKPRNEFMQELAQKGITPTNVVDPKGWSGNRERLFFRVC
jgi:ABC-2 type transport system permease protein